MVQNMHACYGTEYARVLWYRICTRAMVQNMHACYGTEYALHNPGIIINFTTQE